MKKRPIGHRPRKVGGKAGACREIRFHRQDVALIGETDFIFGEKIVPLSGHHHIFVTVGPKLDGAVELLGSKRCECCELISLGFLTAETAAHAACEDGHRMDRDLQDIGDHMLDFARMLGGGPHRHLVILAGNGKRNMPFEIEMLLPADAHLARKPARCLRKRAFGIPALEGQRIGDHRIVLRPRVKNVGGMRQVVIGKLRLAGGSAGDLAGFRDHHEHHLAVKFDPLFRQQRLVVLVVGSDIVVARDVLVGIDRDNARHRFDARQIELENIGMRPVGEPGGHVQRAFGHSHVIDIIGLARDMLVGGIVPEIGMDGSGNLFLEGEIHLVHRRPPYAKRRSMAGWPSCSR